MNCGVLQIYSDSIESTVRHCQDRPTPTHSAAARFESLRGHVGRCLLRLDCLHALGHGGGGAADGVRHVKVLQDLQAHVDLLPGGNLEGKRDSTF